MPVARLFFRTIIILGALAAFSTSSRAADYLGRFDPRGDIVEDVLATLPTTIVGAYPVVEVRNVSYRHWAASRTPHGVPIYNRPCLVNDGVSTHAAPCEAVAGALAGYTPGLFAMATPVNAFIEQPPVFYPVVWRPGAPQSVCCVHRHRRVFARRYWR